MVDLGCQDTDREGRKDRGFRCDFIVGWAYTSQFELGQENMVILSAILVSLRP